MIYKYFYVDPMSYNNLEVYDLNLLSKFNKKTLYFFGNKKIKQEIEFTHKLIYNYSDKRGFNKVVSYFISQLKLFFFILKEKPKLIHFQWFKVPALDFLLLFFINFFFSKVKIVYTAHNILPHDSGDKYSKIYKKIYKLVDRIIVHDINTKVKISNMFKIAINNIKVIEHGLIKLENKKENFTPVLNENSLNNKIVFAFLGHINKYKGIDLLLSAWSSTKSLYENSNIELLVVGKGGEQYCKEFKKFNNVTVINKYLSNTQFLNVISLSDVVILPYREISQSGVLLTVLNEKKFVIVSNKGGLSNPFKYGNVGWLLEELNSDNIQKLLIEISENFKKGDVIDQNTMNKIYTAYSWDNISKKTNKLYKLLINE